MKTDLDRLHAVFDGTLTGRGCGLTFLQCHEVAGAVEVGHKRIVIAISFGQEVYHVESMLRKVFVDHELPLLNINKFHFICGDAHIKFFIMSNPFHVADMEQRYSEFYYVSMGHVTDSARLEIGYEQREIKF